MKFLLTGILIVLAFNKGLTQTTIDFEYNSVINTANTIRKNSIAKETIYTYQLASAKNRKDSTLSAIFLFDAPGNLTSKTTIKSKKKKEEQLFYYDTKNRLIYTSYFCACKKKEQYFTNYYYDSIGNQVLAITTNADSSFKRTIKKTYNEFNQPSYFYVKQKSTDFLVCERYYYDSTHQLIKRDFIPNGDVRFIQSYEFVTLSPLHKKTIHKSYPSIYAYEEDFYYNDFNQLEKEINRHVTVTYTYHQDATIDEQILLVDNIPTTKRKHFYQKY